VIRSIYDDYQKIETDRHDVRKTIKLVTKRLVSIEDLDLTLGIQTNLQFLKTPLILEYQIGSPMFDNDFFRLL